MLHQLSVFPRLPPPSLLLIDDIKYVIQINVDHPHQFWRLLYLSALVIPVPPVISKLRRVVSLCC